MQRRHRSIFLLAIAITAIGCSNKKEVKAAKGSVYDIDFAIVYSNALAATRELYASLDDNPGAGQIKTSWHQVSYANQNDDLGNQRTVAAGQGVQSGQNSGTVSPGAAAAGMPTRLAYKRYFVRFDVTVAGGRPWRVKVLGHAAEWDPGNALPTELRGMARPPWLDGRIEALQVAIYRKIKSYAIPAKEEVAEVNKELELPKTDPGSFKNLLAPQAKALAAIKDALALRDNAALRARLADDVVWSLGGTPGADTAMAMWQADPETLDAMSRAITGGCGVVDKKVACPPGPPVTGAFQLIVEQRGDAWKVTSFVKAE
jgi:hypothetical protein